MANNAIFNAYREFQAPYTEGLKPFSSEFKAAQKKPSRDWHNGGKSSRSGDSYRENPSQGGGGLLVLAAVVGGGYLLWQKNQTDKAKVALAAAALNNRPA